MHDLSDQMINHTITRCEIAVLNNDPIKLLSTLALMKGRIRLLTTEIPQSLLDAESDDFKEAVALEVPAAFFLVVAKAFERLAAGRTMALVEHIALRGNELIVTYCIVSPEGNHPGGFYSALPGPTDYDPSLDLRGRDRAKDLVAECRHLLNEIRTHTRRCGYVMPDDGSVADESGRKSMQQWTAELEPALKRLGELFFPDDVLDEFRSHKVEHVVLAIDPLLVGIPYSALIGKYGAIVDEPWSLSLVTASTELIRAVDRDERRDHVARPLAWFGPDKDVNERLGGNHELQHLSQLAALSTFHEDAATLPKFIEQLNAGHWCHFRGHGSWTGSVETSGPVLAANEVLSTQHYTLISSRPSFLFTAACLTGFGEAVGVELAGSLVDCDRANLNGAILTSWPIDGNAATVFSRFFYEELRNSSDAAKSLKLAAQRTRALLPHPSLWAPFSLVGAWLTEGMIQWINAA